MNPHLISRLARRTLGLIGAIGVLTSGFAAIAVGPKDSIFIGGFVSQGFIQTSGNNYPFDASDGSFDFHELGVNVSTTFGSHLRVGAQGFAQKFGPYGEDKPRLDWAVADYNFRQEVGVRVGRIKYPKGLYGEALDLDALRPFVFLPLPLYNPIVRDFTAAFDGAMLYGNVGLGSAGSVDYKVFYGDIPMDTDQGVADFFLTTGIYDTTTGLSDLSMDSVAGASFDWATPVNGLKVHASYSTFSNLNAAGNIPNLPIALPIDLLLLDYNYLTVGSEYMVGDWTFAGEYQLQTGSGEISTPVAPTSYAKVRTVAYYLMATRRFGDRWEVGSTWSRDTNPKAAPGTPKKLKLSEDFAVAVRYNYSDHLLFKLEWHNVDGQLDVFNTPRVSNPAGSVASATQFWAAKTTYTF